MRNPIRLDNHPPPPQPTPQPSPPPPPPAPPVPSITLTEPTKRKHPSCKTIRAVRSMLRSFPIITPVGCRISSFPGSHTSNIHNSRGSSSRTTCTLYGPKKGNITVSFQEAPGYLPSLLIELPIHTNAIHKELRTGMVRIALECEKKPESEQPLSSGNGNRHGGRRSLLEEEVWSLFWNGKKNGFGVKRDANEADLHIMELLKVVTMGVGVVPTVEGSSEVAYIRATFEHVVGSKDSETFYMLTPDGNTAPELTIFFVRL